MPPTQPLAPTALWGVAGTNYEKGSKSPKHIMCIQFILISFSFSILVVSGSMPWTMATELSGTGTDDD